MPPHEERKLRHFYESGGSQKNDSLNGNEKVTFLFPSHIAYGYHGDNKKIGTNQPLVCTVSLHNFVSETALRKEVQLRETPTNTPATMSPNPKAKAAAIKHKDTITN